MSDAQIPDDELKALEREVGDLLAEAESLGDQLAAEVGSSPPADAKKPEVDGFEGLGDDDIAGRLAQAEAATQEAAEQLGVEAAPPKKVKKISLPPKGAGAKSAVGADTDKPKSTDPAPAASTARATASRSTPAATLSARAGGPEQADRLVAARIEQPVVELPPRPGLGQRIRTWGPVALMASTVGGTARGVVVTLEALDRPFQRIGYGVRSVLGWCALAMLTAAIALYFFAIR